MNASESDDNHVPVSPSAAKTSTDTFVQQISLPTSGLIAYHLGAVSAVCHYVLTRADGDEASVFDGDGGGE